jgi:hypothetical protein
MPGVLIDCAAFLIQHDAAPDPQEPEWSLLADEADFNFDAPIPQKPDRLQLADKAALNANFDVVDHLPPPLEVITIDDDDDDYVVLPKLLVPSPTTPKNEPDVSSIASPSPPRYLTRERRAP